MAQNLKPNQIATATSTILGRVTAGTGDVEQLTPAQTKTLLSLENVTNTSDANKPVSTAQQTALDLKANLASPTFTGVVVAPAINGVSGIDLRYNGSTKLTISSTGATVTGDVAATGAFQTSLTGSATTGAGQFYLNGATSNRIDFNTNGLAAPAFTTRSAGTKIAIYPNISASTVDYAIGANTNTMWFSTGTTSTDFKWYGGTTLGATLTGAGALTLVGAIAASNFSGTSSGTNTGDQTTITGNAGTATALQNSRNFSISGSGITAATVGFTGAANVVLAASVDAGHITLARMANLAAMSVIGNNTGSAAVPAALSTTQLTGLIETFSSANGITAGRGSVPASGGGTANFLRADGTWAAPTSISDGDKGDVLIGSSGTVFTVESANGAFTVKNGATAGATTDSTGSSIYFGYNTSETFRHSIKSRHNAGNLANNALDFWLHKGDTDTSTSLPSRWAATLDTAGLGINGQLSVFSGATLNASISSAGAASLKGLQVSAAGAAMVLAIPSSNDGRLEFTVGGATIGSVGANGSAVTLGAAFGKTVDFAIAGTTIASIDSNSLDVNGSVVINGASSGLYLSDRDGSGAIQLFNNGNALNFHNGTSTVSYMLDTGQWTGLEFTGKNLIIDDAAGTERNLFWFTAGSYVADIQLMTDNVTLKYNVPTKHRFDVNGLNKLNIDSSTISTDSTFVSTNANQMLLKNGSASNQTAILRNDGSNTYVLLSDAGTTPSSTWNALRPLTIANGTGLLSSSNGQTFAGGTTITGNLFASAAASIGHTGTPADKLHVRGDATSAATGIIIQNRATTGAIAQLTFITSGLDFSDNRYAAIRSSGGASNTLEFLTSNGAAPAVAMYLSATGHLYTKDIHASRGDGTGVVYLNAADTRYLYYDGTQYVMPAAGLLLNGSLVPAVGNNNTWTNQQLFTSTGAFAGSPVANLHALGDGSNGAWMAFHRSSTYAVFAGLDTDNVFKIGAWSDGAGVARMTLDSAGTMTLLASPGATDNSTKVATTAFVHSAVTPMNTFGAGFTVSDAHNSQYIRKTSGTTMTVTLPTSGVNAGMSCVIVNRVSGNVTLSAANGMYKNGASSTATSGTLAFGGKVTVFHEGSGVWTVDGSGLT